MLSCDVVLIPLDSISECHKDVQEYNDSHYPSNAPVGQDKSIAILGVIASPKTQSEKMQPTRQMQ